MYFNANTYLMLIDLFNCNISDLEREREGVRIKEGRVGMQTGIFKVRLGLGETEIQGDRET